MKNHAQKNPFSKEEMLNAIEKMSIKGGTSNDCKHPLIHVLPT